MACGIYSIKCLGNGKMYIGKTVQNFNKRWNKHVLALEKKEHDNSYLQRSWNKYGKENFVFEVIEVIDKEYIKNNPEKLGELEKYYIEELKTKNPNGFNLTDGGDGCQGRVVSQETRKKMSDARIGKVNSESTRQKISENQKGEKHHWFGTHRPEETRRKISIANSGENHHMFGKTHSEESIRKMRESSPRRKQSDEIRDRISKIKTGTKNKGSSSIYFGVYKYTHQKDIKWQVTITVSGKGIYLGRFFTEVEAAKVYDKYVVENNLNRPLNFPEDILDD